MSTKPHYPWNTAPSFANFAATDRDGNAYWYSDKPAQSDKRLGYWYCHGFNSRSVPIYPTPDIHLPWDQSLEAKP